MNEMFVTTETLGRTGLNTAALEAVGDSGATKKRWKINGALLDVLGKPTMNKTFYDKGMIPLEQLKKSANEKSLYLYRDHTKQGEPVENGNALEKAGILVTNLWWEDKDNITEVYYDGVVLNEGSGKIISEILEVGGTIGYSKRGGTAKWVPLETKQYGTVYKPTPYKFLAYDIVTGQSVPEAQHANEVAIFEQNTNEEVHMDPITVEKLREDKALWATVTEAVQKEQKVDALVTERVKTATDELTASLEQKFQPVKEQAEKLRTAVVAITEALKTAGIIDEKEATEKEKELSEKVTSLETELKTLKDEKASVEQKLADATKADEKTALTKEVVEQEFAKFPGGVAVMEQFSDKEYFAVDEIKAQYDAVSAMAKAVLETSDSGNPSKGAIETTDDSIPPAVKEEKAADLKKRMGKA